MRTILTKIIVTVAIGVKRGSYKRTRLEIQRKEIHMVILCKPLQKINKLKPRKEKKNKNKRDAEQHFFSYLKVIKNHGDVECPDYLAVLL